MLAKTGESITVGVFYTAGGVGKTGLTVTVDVYRDGVSLLTAQSATETGGGMYRYTLAGGNTGSAGFYTFIFKTSDTTVDRQQWGDAWIVGQSWLSNIDAAISGVAAGVWDVATASHTAAGSFGLFAQNIAANVWVQLTSALTTVGSVGKLLVDNINATITSRASATDYTTARAAKLDNLDAAVSTRLATASYTAPLDSAGTAAATQTGLTAQGYTTTRAGYLDNLLNILANFWSYGTRTLTSVINAIVVSPVNPTNQTITLTTGTDYNLTDYDRAISITSTSWPDLTAGTVQFLVSTQGGGAYTAYGSVTITNPGGGGASQTVNIILTNAQNNFVPAPYSYQLMATLSSGRKAELASGTLIVNP